MEKIIKTTNVLLGEYLKPIEGDCMKDLFDECEFGDLHLNSRIIRTGTWEREIENGGFLETSVFERYEKIASSGVGLINSEMFVMDSRDRFAEYCNNINHKSFIKDYKEITDIAHEYNVPILGQLAPFYYNDGNNQKVEANDISIEGIRRFQAEVIMAAKKFSFAGFDGIQINMGNNFYLARFVNPYFNQRTDNYGGNTLNRTRIVLEIIRTIKNNMDMHVGLRINPTDGRKGGMTYNESKEIAKLLARNGADSIQLTGRTITLMQGYLEGHNPYLDYVNELSDELDIPIVLGGTMRDSESINNVLNNTKVDFVSMSKPFVAQGDFLKDWKANGGKGTSICQTCNNCYSKKESRCFKN